MKYAKIINSATGCLERTEKRKTILVEGTEISKNEYKCLSAAIEIFVCGLDTSDVMAKYFPTQVNDESEVGNE